MKLKTILFCFLCLVSLSLSHTKVALAQTPPPLQIVQVQCIPDAYALVCDLLVRFPADAAQPTSFIIYHGGQGHLPEEVLPVEGAAEVIILVDSSGSMAGYSDDENVKNQLLEILKTVPAGTRVAIVPFKYDIAAERAIYVGPESFTNNWEDWNKAVNAIQAEPNAGTCLYDATYQAVEYLRQAVGPSTGKGVIILSDGLDEPSRGESGTQCSTHTLEDAVALATADPANQVRISTLGLGRDIQFEVLQTLAGRTGGRAGFYDELGNLFPQIIQDLQTQQWRVRVRLWPAEGENRATLTANFPDGPVSADFLFYSQANFDFAAVAIQGIYYNAAAGTTQLIPELINPQNAAHWQVQLFLGEDGEQAVYPAPFEYEGLQNLQVVDLPTDALTAGEAYHAQICAVNQDGIRLKDLQENPVCAQAAFLYQPATLSFDMFLELNDQQELLADLRVTNSDGQPIEYEVQLFGKDNFRLYNDSDTLIEPLLTIPFAEQADGEYTLLVSLTPADQTPIYRSVTFLYEKEVPLPLDFTIQAGEINEQNELVLTLLLATPVSTPVESTVWLKRENGDLVAGPIPTTLRDNTITVPLDELATGTYLVDVSLEQPLNMKSSVIDHHGPGLISRIVSSVRAHPPILLGIILIAVGTAVFLAVSYLLDRLRTGAVSLEPIHHLPLEEHHDQRAAWRMVPLAVAGALRERLSGRPAAEEIALTRDPQHTAGPSAASQPRPPIPVNTTNAAPLLAHPIAKVEIEQSPGKAHPAGFREINHFPFTIGREGCDLTVPDGKVSRQHAVITLVDGRFLIKDCRSTNGTFLNGRRIGVDIPTHLPVGEAVRITLGKHTSLVLLVEGGPPQRSPAALTANQLSTL